ncbi:putative TIR domain, winged helix-turn-helix DNA-binding domain-containing protein [Medicago truncatula]|uniref:Disease resistance protein (TIR-NBS-LRR class) n=1 Tax=Medicago truncatula TaxID=3880 RepID=A0A072U7H6_MEDTR|nr:disease resistance protein RUN1 [Medicago truncatula]KEH25073.1 disease resistance protein (TIR-NBS-LRR class) [Medicago truncatula]RHN50195.1 putative TIR domain, winged helix-turn-helix DNA-binding domain-containing protein [Medicago truncatula]
MHPYMSSYSEARSKWRKVSIVTRAVFNFKSLLYGRNESRIHDVFLSFRGEDTRSSFTSHLYASLRNSGIKVFREDDSLQRGDHISTSLLRAIEQSRMSIIIFSTNYAESRWCLDELVKIMECNRTIGQIVLPVFLDVDPSEVRHQTSEFGKAFQILLNRRIEKEEPELIEFNLEMKWRTALRQAAGLAGFVVLNLRNESDVIEDIVENVTRKLDKADLFIANNPVGVESRVQDMIQLLDQDIQLSNDVLLLGMWGMGGVGKTTIAKAIYNKIGRNFEGRSFLANIREVWDETAGKLNLQEQLLFDICKVTAKVPSIESGKTILKDRLSQKRVLILLDDVTTLDQLNALCGSRKWFGSGSRIIITTRDRHILRGNRVNKVFKMKHMDESESIKLFSWHAFKQAGPTKDFAAISRKVVEYSGGLPLALEVLGSYLFDREVTEWKSVLDKLKRIPNNQVQEKLRISYDALNDDTEKEIFLDIACFFIGMDRNDVTLILNGCGLFAEIGISILVERSLVIVDKKNKLGMHDLLRDMGREIVRGKSPEELEERCRLWFQEDALQVLSEQTGTKTIKGLALKLPRSNEKCFSTKAFKKMKRLRLLQLAGVNLDGDFEYLSRNLIWLSWNGCCLPHIPENFYRENLVSIELENSNVKLLWKVAQRMEKLKILNLSHSHCLMHTPDFSYMPNLEKLVLKDCPILSEVSPTIGKLSEILLIDLEDCVSLRNLPRSIYKLKSLKTLILSGCIMIDKLEEDIEQMESLTTLLAHKTAIKRIPFSVVRSKSIGYISLCGYEGFSRDVFPSIILSWMSPTNNLPSLFQTSTIMPSLVPLDVPHSSSHELSSISKYLPSLRSLWVECSSEHQLSNDATIILDALYATLSKDVESTSATSQISNMITSALTQHCDQLHVPCSELSMKSVLIQMGMNCQVTNNLKENMLQKMDGNGFGEDSSVTYNCEGSSVTFEVPQMKGRMLKTIMICIVYSSTPDNIASDGLTNLLVKNYTKSTIQLYKREALISFEDEEGQRVVSSIEPGNKVDFVVVFENGFVVKRTTVYLIYDEPIAEKGEECHAQDKNVIVSSGDENECFLGEISSHAQHKNESIVCSGEENECFVRKVSPQVVPVDDLTQQKKKNLQRKWKTIKQC